MAKETYKNVRKNRFTQVGNDLLWDKKLSLEAKGLLSIFLSNSDDWELNMKEIIKRSKNGRDAHYTIVKELIKNGYFARVEVREKGKFVELIYVFSDDKRDVMEELEAYKNNPNIKINPERKANKPFTEIQDTVVEPFTEIQDTVKQDTDKPYSADQYINNNKGNNTKINNTNDNNNLSIYLKEEYKKALSSLYEKKSMPILALKQISVYMDRLIEDNIHPYRIEVFYNDFTEHKLDDDSFSYVLGNVLGKTKNKIGDFEAVMKRSSKNYFKNYQSEDEE